LSVTALRSWKYAIPGVDIVQRGTKQATIQGATRDERRKVYGRDEVAETPKYVRYPYVTPIFPNAQRSDTMTFSFFFPKKLHPT
jgi:hypothetical protein